MTILDGPAQLTQGVASMRRRLLTSEPGLSLDGAYPFAPFSLAPDEFRAIVEDRVLGCPSGDGAEEPGDAFSFDSITVRYRLFLVEHEARLPLGDEVVIDYSHRTACPSAEDRGRAGGAERDRPRRARLAKICGGSRERLPDLLSGGARTGKGDDRRTCP